MIKISIHYSCRLWYHDGKRKSNLKYEDVFEVYAHEFHIDYAVTQWSASG